MSDHDSDCECDGCFRRDALAYLVAGVRVTDEDMIRDLRLRNATLRVALNQVAVDAKDPWARAIARAALEADDEHSKGE